MITVKRQPRPGVLCNPSLTVSFLTINFIQGHYVLYRRFIRDSLRPSLKMVYNGINIIIYHIYIHICVIGTTKKTYQDTPVLQNPISGA